MKNKKLIIYRIVTGLFSAFMLLSASFYLFQNEVAVEAYTKLGFPTYIIYPLAILKILGVAAIWSRKSEFLKEWAYAGFFFNLLLGVSAHINVGDGEFAGALIGWILVLISYVLHRRLYGSTKA